MGESRAILDGTEWDGDREVPAYRPRVGVSVDDAAASLGLRVLSRREVGETVAIIVDSGIRFRCVRKE